jgi:GNAT superfamily N-acetyltransferase
VIRQVRREDWQRLRAVRLRALASDPQAFLETHARASTFPDELWQERATPDDTRAAFVVERDGRFDAMTSCFVADDPENVFLVGMWVEPDLRGTGVAGELVERVLAWSRCRGARLVCLSIEPRNVRAARLYESHGFVETAEPPPFPYEPLPADRFFVCQL